MQRRSEESFEYTSAEVMVAVLEVDGTLLVRGSKFILPFFPGSGRKDFPRGSVNCMAESIETFNTSMDSRTNTSGGPSGCRQNRNHRRVHGCSGRCCGLHPQYLSGWKRNQMMTCWHPSYTLCRRDVNSPFLLSCSMKDC